MKHPVSRRAVRRRGGYGRTVLVMVLLSVLLGGCLQMPTEGPVIEAERAGTSDSEVGAFYEPRRPSKGATPDEIVFGFLEAMKATPLRTSVAAEFLSKRAQRAWKPEDATMTYGDLDQPDGQLEVSVQLIDAQAYDLRGAWSHRLGQREANVTFPMAIEGEEWRIDAAPDALIVPERWFDEWFERASLHFFDPTRSILVPEPVFVPGGDQMATSLVRGLLAGSPDRSVSRGAFPAEARLAVSSVPIDDSGVAQVVLEAGGGAPDESVAEEMLAQLASTLRQVPGVSALRLSIDDEPVTLPGGAREISVESGLAFTPTGSGSSRDLFALQDGRVVRGELNDFAATTGPFGSEDAGLRSAAISLKGDRVVGVTRSGTSALLAPTSEGDEAVEIVSGATDLLPPRIDFADRVWLVDRTSRGARVLVRGQEGTTVEVQVPGVSGKAVRHFLVSRDASRLVVVLREANRDKLVVHRVDHRVGGGPPGFGDSREIDLGPDIGKRITGVGWLSPVSIGVLSNLTPDLAQIRALSVDGAPGGDGLGGSRIRGDATQLISSPMPNDPVLVVTDGRVTDANQLNRRSLEWGDSITWLGFVG